MTHGPQAAAQNLGETLWDQSLLDDVSRLQHFGAVWYLLPYVTVRLSSPQPRCLSFVTLQQ